ncbi:MAG: CDP-alcohol phosphatidyltransferase family protein [Oligoflexia bacterium]|nr:CDP-alcohol phosphatidyltransferase family protein [Oligoflexia bacterium]
MPAHFFNLSNLLTYVSLLAGLSSVLWAKKGLWHLAAVNLGISVLADIFDGKFASLFHRTTIEREFGAQLDSLADAIVFGFVPVINLLFLIEGIHDGTYYLFLLCGFFYLLSAVTRLGYFNLHPGGHKVFTGLPTTIAAMAWLIIYFFEPNRLWAACAFVILGVLMISGIQIPRPSSKGLLVIVAILIGLIATHQFFTIP